MRASNKNLTILSEAEQAALYEIPDFDDEQRLNYLNLTCEEQALMRNRASLPAQVHCAIQISYFKAKHMFFPSRYAKLLADENSLIAVIIAQALNNGNLNMAEISDIPYDSLLDVYQSRVRLQTLKKGNDIIGDDIALMPIFPFYSLDMAILFGGVDGQKYEVENHTLKARRSKKYFKKGKGVVAYTMLVNHIPLQTELIGAHEHESYFAFDIWYNNTSSIVPDAITGVTSHTNLHSSSRVN